MCENQAMDTLYLDATETHAALKSDRLKPELRDLILSFHVHVRRLLAVARVEKEPIPTQAQYRRHPTMMDRARGPLQARQSKRRSVRACGLTTCRSAAGAARTRPLAL